jgi:hypothetical protein
MFFPWQAAAFADHVASGALSSEFAAERQRLEGRIERLRAQHVDAVRDKSPAENKSHRLAERLATAEAEKEDIRRRLAEERSDANKACAQAQSMQAEAKLVRAGASLARQRRGDGDEARQPARPPGQDGGLDARGGRADAYSTCGRVPGAGCADRTLRSARSGGGPPLPWMATGGAGGAPNHCDGPHVLRLPRHLRGCRECLVPRGVWALRGL